MIHLDCLQKSAKTNIATVEENKVKKLYWYVEDGEMVIAEVGNGNKAIGTMLFDGKEGAVKLGLELAKSIGLSSTEYAVMVNKAIQEMEGWG